MAIKLLTISLIENKNLKLNSGTSIMEIVIVIAIIGTTFIGLLGLATYSLNIFSIIKKSSQAEMIAQETVEAVRNFRDRTTWDVDGLGTLTVATDYYPKIDTIGASTTWNLIGGTETIDNFTRKIVFNNVSRDGNDNIIVSGGTNDPNTRKITATVLWENRSVEIVTYLTNWKQ